MTEYGTSASRRREYRVHRNGPEVCGRAPVTGAATGRPFVSGGMYGADSITITSTTSVDPLQWYYTVTITNGTTDTFEVVQAFYKSTRIPQGVGSANAYGLAPGGTAVLRLGVCAEMISYTVAFVIDGWVVWSVPDPDGWNPDGTIILNHNISWQDGLARDSQRCEDSWIIEP